MVFIAFMVTSGGVLTLLPEYLRDSLILNGGEPVELYAGKTFDLTTVSEKKREYDLIKWESSDPEVVKVDLAGDLHAVGEGYAQVRAYVADKERIQGTCQVHVKYKEKKVKNGHMFREFKGEPVSPVKVTCSKDSDAYVFFKNKDESEDSFAFYVKAGKTVEFKAPLGTYEVNYATGGTKWYGKKYMFGRTTKMTRHPDDVKLYIEGYTIYGIDLKIVQEFKTFGGDSDSSIEEVR